MKKIHIQFSEYEYPNDVDRIIRIFAHQGYDISPGEAAYLWQRYSDSMAATWLVLPSDDDAVFAAVRSYFSDKNA